MFRALVSNPISSYGWAFKVPQVAFKSMTYALACAIDRLLVANDAEPFAQPANNGEPLFAG